jgi:hypothetical protein
MTAQERCTQLEQQRAFVYSRRFFYDGCLPPEERPEFLQLAADLLKFANALGLELKNETTARQ